MKNRGRPVQGEQICGTIITDMSRLWFEILDIILMEKNNSSSCESDN